MESSTADLLNGNHPSGIPGFDDVEAIASNGGRAIRAATSRAGTTAIPTVRRP